MHFGWICATHPWPKQAGVCCMCMGANGTLRGQQLRLHACECSAYTNLDNLPGKTRDANERCKWSWIEAEVIRQKKRRRRSKDNKFRAPTLPGGQSVRTTCCARKRPGPSLCVLCPCKHLSNNALTSQHWGPFPMAFRGDRTCFL